MASMESQKLIALFEATMVKEAMTIQLESGETAGAYDSPEPPQEIENEINVARTRFGESNLFRLSPKEKTQQINILYLHGGGYVGTFSKFHWQFLARLTRRTGCTITTPDYPLAPEHPYPKALDLAADLYTEMITTIDPQMLILMGDSAGAGLCLAVAQIMRDKKVTQPREIILLSPWLDVTLENPDIQKIDPIDPFLSVQGCRLAGKAYAGTTDPTHPHISPINGELHGLPGISIFTGSRDILTPDAGRLAAMLKAGGHKCIYDEFEGMFHVWMLFDLPESDQVIDRISKRCV